MSRLMPVFALLLPPAVLVAQTYEQDRIQIRIDHARNLDACANIAGVLEGKPYLKIEGDAVGKAKTTFVFLAPEGAPWNSGSVDQWKYAKQGYSAKDLFSLGYSVGDLKSIGFKEVQFMHVVSGKPQIYAAFKIKS